MRVIDGDKLKKELLQKSFFPVLVAEALNKCELVDAVQVVHCEYCTIKKAVQHKDGIVWRCPHRTGDVKMEGYCESGVRADERFGEG